MSNLELSKFLLSIALLALTAISIGNIFGSFKLPKVIGEIFAGVILGPSFLGYFDPNLFNWIFNSYEGQEEVLSAFYWFGLILLMFTAGFSVKDLSGKRDLGLVILLVIGGLTIPFAGGMVLAPEFMQSNLTGDLVFSIIIGVAVSVTSIPVLSKIFIDLGLIDTRFSSVVLRAALLQDLFLYTILSIALSLNNTFHIQILIEKVGLESLKIIIFIVFGFIIFGAIKNILIRFTVLMGEGLVVGLMLVGCVFLSASASLLGINVIFGGLFAGVLIGRLSDLNFVRAREKISELGSCFFVPIYFSLVGLKIDLPTSFDLYLFIKFFVASSLIKIISIIVFCKARGLKWGNSLDFGISMNARGGPGIVLASLAYDAAIIDEKLFVVLVLSSIFTSLLAGLWLHNRKSAIRNYCG